MSEVKGYSSTEDQVLFILRKQLKMNRTCNVDRRTKKCLYCEKRPDCPDILIKIDPSKVHINKYSINPNNI